MKALIQLSLFVQARDNAHLETMAEEFSKGMLAGMAERAAEYGADQETIDKFVIVMPVVSHIVPDSLEWSE